MRDTDSMEQRSTISSYSGTIMMGKKAPSSVESLSDSLKYGNRGRRLFILESYAMVWANSAVMYS